MALVMKSGKKVKSFYDFKGSDKNTIRFKKTIVAKYKLNSPLVSWPKDKEKLLGIINTFLSYVEIAKLDMVADAMMASGSKLMNDMLDASKNVSELVADAPKVIEDEKKDDEQKETSESKDTDNANADAESVSDNKEENAKQTEAKEGESSEKEESSEQSEVTPADNQAVASGDDEDVVIDEGEYVEIPDQLYDIDNCSAKVLGNIVRILNYRSKIIRKIRLMRKANMEEDRINNEIEKVVVYNIVLAKFLPILNKQETIDKVNLKTATKLFEDVCVEGYQEIPTQSNIENEIKKNKEDQDFDIVAALSYVGVSVDKDDYGYYSVRSYNNGRGIKYFIGKKEKAFALSKASCHRFVDEFLNKPIEKRKFITPGQVFISYINEAEKSLGINSRSAVELTGLFGAMNSSKNTKQYFKDMIKKYSRNAEEWKDFQKLFEAEYYSNKESKDDVTNKIHIKQQAKRLVIGEIFEEFINYGDILTPEQINLNDYRVSDISRDFGLDFDIAGIDVNRTRIERLEDQTFRIVNSMHNILQQLRAFTQDIIDNYTVDYLRKEKIFLMQQDDQNEYISKKKEYEDLIKRLSYDKGKDSNAKIAYYQAQVDELTQKIGSNDYVEAKNILLKSKNNFRILLINAKAQKEKVLIAINEAKDKADREKRTLSIDEKLEIMREVLSSAPELVITFDRGKATSWTKHKVGEKAEKKQEPLSEVDRTIEATAAKISDESHQKIMQENLIREKVKKSQKEDRVKSVNAYINAYGSIVGNATGVGAFGGVMPNIPGNSGGAGNVPTTTGPTFSPATTLGMPSHTAPDTQMSGPISVASNAPSIGGSPKSIATPRNIANLQTTPQLFGASTQNAGEHVDMGVDNLGNTRSMPSTPVNNVAPVAPVQPVVNGGVASTPMYSGVMPAMPMMGMMPMSGMPAMPQANNQPNYNRDYQNFDYVSDGIEPCILPYIVGYASKGVTLYGNMMEKYATMDRYKFLLTTNNNALYTYIETKQQQIQTPEQVISDLHIRYIKNAMSKSGLSTLDSNLSAFDYKGDIRRFLGQYVPQNMIDMVISDYNELIETIDFDMLRDLIEHKFMGDLENYIPESMKEDVVKCANLIASVAKVIMSDNQIKRTYDAYSSKMKQTYIDELIVKIESGQIPTVKLDSDKMYSRMLDYISFSIKGQNVIIQSEDAKDSGLATYPRSIYFRQKENADNALKGGKTLSFEQNEIITTRNEPTLSESGNNVVNLFGTLYKFNGAYSKLLLKLKPYTLTGGVKFMENLVDALNEKIDLKITVLNQDKKKNTVSLVKFASKEKEKVLSDEDKVFDYEDDNWFVRKGFVLNKNKIREYYLLVAFGFKYGLDRTKAKLKEDFYNNNILSLNKINETFKDQPEDMIALIRSVIRDVMMSNCERVIDYLDFVNDRFSATINKMLYINRMIIESNNFDKKDKNEKLETLIALDLDFMTKAEDLITPHPEIYSTIEEIEHYEKLYLYYSLTELFEKMTGDERIITKELTDYFEELKRKFRSTLLGKIRDKISLNGYEQNLAKYFELKLDNVLDIEMGPKDQAQDDEEIEGKEIAKLQNIDVIFKGILDGFNKAMKSESNAYVLDQMKEVAEVLEYVGALPGPKTPEKDLEIALPNNQTIICNVKGFLQQYLFRYIVDKEHELGPFAYVVSELVEHEEMSDTVKNIEIVANKLNAPELGINLLAKFSSISMTNNGNVFKIGDNISTVLEIINRLKTPTDQQKALNRDVFYKEGVAGVQALFEQYFNRLKLEQID